MAYKTTTIQDTKTALGAAILPFFQEGKLALDRKDIAESRNHWDVIRLVELSQETASPAAEASTEPKYLSAPALNFHKEYIDNTSFPKALKQAEYYIDECVDITIADLKYHTVNKSLRQGLLAKKVYGSIELQQPIVITHDGNTFPVATFNARFYLPESVCFDLAREYVGKYPDEMVLKLSVKGPAALFGGYTEGAFTQFYCLNYHFEVYAESYTVAVAQ